MKFDFNNPLHVKILKEELNVVRTILKEEHASNYSVDAIWAAMTDDERKKVLQTALGQSASAMIEKLSTGVWDKVPADIQDKLDLSDYELAKNDVDGRSYLRGIQNIQNNRFKNSTQFELIKQTIQKLIDKFCMKVNRDYSDLTVKQAMQLNINVQRLVQKIIPANKNNDSDIVAAMIAADKESGRYHPGSLGD